MSRIQISYEESKIKCDECKIGFTTFIGLKSHKGKMHDNKHSRL